jgi:hypothetical protein
MLSYDIGAEDPEVGAQLGAPAPRRAGLPELKKLASQHR